MIFLVVYLFCVMAALGLGLVAAWNDFKGMTIPNYIALSLIAAFVIGYGAAWSGGADVFASFVSHLGAGLTVFAFTFVMFATRLIGGGDSKLAAAYSFWFGFQSIAVFLFYMVFSGAIVAVIALVLKKIKPVKNPPTGSWIARTQAGESVVPYGIAIFIGAVAAFSDMGIFNPESLTLFLVQN